ncbi:MAG: hypothetical protein JRN06_01850 [Nitrososphaerota archaeon]|nr:hypothetical protein [Nitrososphaerota archaeon]MDG7023401.1 hypothetical protein [Nitrososphaerota archaeon]
MPGIDFFGRFAKPFRKTIGPLMRRPSEEDLIAAVIERIPIDGEPAVHPDADGEAKKEGEFRRLVRRLEHQFAASGVTTDEMLRYYDKPLNAVLLLRHMEKYKRKPSLEIRERLQELGFTLVHDNVWVLPPSRTPEGLNTQEDIKAWVRSKLTKSLRKDYQYVIPFIAVVDLRKVTAERYRVVKRPEARTIFSVIDQLDLLPPSYVYSYMKKKGFSLEEFIRSGDLIFLASAFADHETMDSLKQSYAFATERIQKLMNTDGVSLSYIADLHEKELGGALEGIIKHPVDFARRLSIEAQYWERLLSGTQGQVGGPENPVRSGDET